MTDKLRAAAVQALDALDCIYSPLHVREINKVGAAMAALRTALAEQPAEQPAEQEPYCYTYTENGEEYFAPPTAYVPDHAKPLYTAPQPAKQPLTEEQQIAEDLRFHGLTLVKTPTGYAVLKLGNVTANDTGETK